MHHLHRRPMAGGQGFSSNVDVDTTACPHTAVREPASTECASPTGTWRSERCKTLRPSPAVPAYRS
jgi:hypothetical protein